MTVLTSGVVVGVFLAALGTLALACSSDDSAEGGSGAGGWITERWYRRNLGQWWRGGWGRRDSTGGAGAVHSIRTHPRRQRWCRPGAAIWESGAAIARVSDSLVSHGVTVPTGWTLTNATGIVQNGSEVSICGTAKNASGNDEAWLARCCVP